MHLWSPNLTLLFSTNTSACHYGGWPFWWGVVGTWSDGKIPLLLESISQPFFVRKLGSACVEWFQNASVSWLYKRSAVKIHCPLIKYWWYLGKICCCLGTFLPLSQLVPRGYSLRSRIVWAWEMAFWHTQSRDCTRGMRKIAEWWAEAN